jgi:hypothetical protein
LARLGELRSVLDFDNEPHDDWEGWVYVVLYSSFGERLGSVEA